VYQQCRGAQLVAGALCLLILQCWPQQAAATANLAVELQPAEQPSAANGEPANDDDQPPPHHDRRINPPPTRAERGSRPPAERLPQDGEGEASALVKGLSAPDSPYPDWVVCERSLVAGMEEVRMWDVTMQLASLVPGQVFTITADEGKYDHATGMAELWGDVVVTTEDGPTLKSEHFTYAPEEGRAQVSGIDLVMPLSAFATEDQLRDDGPRAEFGSHFYTPQPENIFLRAREADFSIAEDGSEYILRDVVLTHHPHPRPDLIVKVRELRMGADNRIVMKGVGIEISGRQLITWPHFVYRIGGSDRMVSFDPSVQYDNEDGLAGKLGTSYKFGDFRIENLLDYSRRHDLLSNWSLVYEPFDGAEFGLETGDRADFDIHGNDLVRTADYNFTYHQFVKGRNVWIRDAEIAAEYGDLTALMIIPTGWTNPYQRRESTRLFIDGKVEFPLKPIGGKWFMTSGAQGRFVHYGSINHDYRAIGGRIGVIWQHDGFDHFLLYKLNLTDGVPWFSFDELSQHELDLMTSFRFVDDWRHVMRVRYDFAESEFSQFKVSALKRQRTYEIGMYWDFARENAGLEFGLLVE
jgi:hypothetical protein